MSNDVKLCIICSKKPILPCKFRGRVTKNAIPTIKLQLFHTNVRIQVEAHFCFSCSKKMVEVDDLQKLIKRLLP